MSTLELKDSLHRLVVETEDEVLLQQVQLFFISLKEKNNNKDWWNTISENEKNLINKGLNDVKQNKLTPNSEVRKSINKRLGKVL